MSDNRVRKDGTQFKKRVEVPELEFFTAYKKALDAGMKLVDFSQEIGQAPATIQQRVTKANNRLKASGHDKRWKYLTSSTNPSRGRKSLTSEELLKILGD